MGKMINFVQNAFSRLFNFQLVSVFPRHSVRFAKNHFKNKPLIVAEIGTFKGENALNMLNMMNIEKLYIIDPYESYEEYGKRDATEKHLPEAYYKAKNILKKYRKKIIFIRKRSCDAVKDIPKCDFIYIDGNHTYKFVKGDIKDYFPKVKNGGILAGHDITNKKFNRDIVRAVIEFSNKSGLIPFISRTDWWFIKKGQDK